MIYDFGDVVVVPFPFVEVVAHKRRPSLILSRLQFNKSSGHSICAMTTTAVGNPWPKDIPIENLAAAGLYRPCVVRWKLFTLPNHIIIKRAGTLGTADRKKIVDTVQAILM